MSAGRSQRRLFGLQNCDGDREFLRVKNFRPVTRWPTLARWNVSRQDGPTFRSVVPEQKGVPELGDIGEALQECL